MFGVCYLTIYHFRLALSGATTLDDLKGIKLFLGKKGEVKNL